MTHCYNCNELLTHDEVYYDPTDMFYDIPMCLECAPQYWVAGGVMLEDVSKLLEDIEDEDDE